METLLKMDIPKFSCSCSANFYVLDHFSYCIFHGRPQRISTLYMEIKWRNFIIGYIEKYKDINGFVNIEEIYAHLKSSNLCNLEKYSNKKHIRRVVHNYPYIFKFKKSSAKKPLNDYTIGSNLIGFVVN